MDDGHTAIRAHVTGRVQGVNFRVWTRVEAVRLGLAGWVRNESDGSVTALLAGPRSAVSAMAEKLWDGPPAGWVSNVTSQEAYPDPWPVDFKVLR